MVIFKNEFGSVTANGFDIVPVTSDTGLKMRKKKPKKELSTTYPKKQRF